MGHPEDILLNSSSSLRKSDGFAGVEGSFGGLGALLFGLSICIAFNSLLLNPVVAVLSPRSARDINPVGSKKLNGLVRA